MLKHTRRRPEMSMSECHDSSLTPSDITGAFHSPKHHPLCLLCTDFPTIPCLHIRTDLWCEMFLPPSLWNLSQPSQSSLDTWLVKITFVELLLALLFLNNPRGWGEGLTAATQADAREHKMSGSLGIVVSSSFLGYSSPLVEETYFLTVVPGPKPLACLVSHSFENAVVWIHTMTRVNQNCRF